MKGCSFELSPSFSLSFFAPKLTEGTSTKKLPPTSAPQAEKKMKSNSKEMVLVDNKDTADKIT